MNVLPVDVNAIRGEHIVRLLTERIAEQRTLDYKEALPGRSDGDKKEFLADIASFANAAGGFLVYGVSERRENGEKTGEPEAVVGVDEPRDEVVRRLEQLAGDGLAPRVPGLAFGWADAVEGDKAVLVVRVPRSWAGPHMVSFKSSSRFYARDSAGRHQLDVQEIRSAFLAGAEVERGLRAFRDDRLGRILSRETPVPLKSRPVVVVHLLPLAHGFEGAAVDVAHADPARLRPVLLGAGGGWNKHHCYEGFVTEPGVGYGYTLLFRSGAIEATMVFGGDDEVVRPNIVERVAKEALATYPAYLWSLGLEPPLVVSVALVGARGTKAPPSPLRLREEALSVVHDVLFFPDALIMDRAFDAPTLMRLTCDAIWQAYGFAASSSFTENGEWDPERARWT